MSDQEKEWLLTDGSGAFAMGCADRKPRRKYHSLLSIADGLSERGGRNLVLDVVESLKIEDQIVPLAGLHDGFRPDPWPSWSWSLTLPRLGQVRVDRVLQTIERGSYSELESGFRLVYTLSRSQTKKSPRPESGCELLVKPQLLSRPIHSLKESNPRLSGMPFGKGPQTWIFKLYDSDPAIVMSWEDAAPKFDPQGAWEAIDHPWETERGYDSKESCFSPGLFSVGWEGTSTLEFSLVIGFASGRGPVIRGSRVARPRTAEPGHPVTEALRAAALSFAVDVEDEGGTNPSLVAGYPWFGPWARDLFVSLPGFSLAAPDTELPYLMMATGGRRLLRFLVGSAEERRAGLNSHGADSPWLYLWALEHLIRQEALTGVQKRVLLELGVELANAVLRDAQPHVKADPKGGLLIEQGPWACTWMDAVFDGVPVTPRNGYPVEVNALYLSGLGFLLEQLKTHRALGKIKECFSATQERFEKLFVVRGCDWLADVAPGSGNHDVSADLSLRPNCLWALALPRVVVPKNMALSTLEAVRSQLLTPIGLRTLSPQDRAYRRQYVGDHRARDHAYHQGTVWPWLLGVYAEAVLRWDGKSVLAKDLRPVRERLERHLFEEGCVGQVSEIFDGEAPHAARGAPAQAWSACELFRMFEELRA